MINVDINTKGSELLRDISNHIMEDYENFYNQLIKICDLHYKNSLRTVYYSIPLYIDIKNYTLVDEPKVNDRILISYVNKSGINRILKNKNSESTDFKYRFIKKLIDCLFEEYSQYISLLINNDGDFDLYDCLNNCRLTIDFFDFDEIICFKKINCDLNHKIFIEIINRYSERFGYTEYLLDFVLCKGNIKCDYIINKFDYLTITSYFESLKLNSKNYCYFRIYSEYIFDRDEYKLAYIHNYIKPNDTKSSKEIVYRFNKSITNVLNSYGKFVKILVKLGINTKKTLKYKTIESIYIKE